MATEIQAVLNGEPIGWHCGCGWPNGLNLASCACCGRNPTEGLGVPYRDRKTSGLWQLVKQYQVARRAFVRWIEDDDRCPPDHINQALTEAEHALLAFDLCETHTVPIVE